MVWEELPMEQNAIHTEEENTKKEDKYTVVIGNNTFHVISQFQGIETASQIIYGLAVKRILYNDSI